MLNLKGQRRSRLFSVAHCLLSAFVSPKPSPKHRATYMDGDRNNLAFTNLKWLGPHENRVQAVANGRGGGWTTSNKKHPGPPTRRRRPVFDQVLKTPIHLALLVGWRVTFDETAMLNSDTVTEKSLMPAGVVRPVSGDAPSSSTRTRIDVSRKSIYTTMVT